MGWEYGGETTFFVVPILWAIDRNLQKFGDRPRFFMVPIRWAIDRFTAVLEPWSVPCFDPLFRPARSQR